jgi:hypothetical protein
MSCLSPKGHRKQQREDTSELPRHGFLLPGSNGKRLSGGREACQQYY